MHLEFVVFQARKYLWERALITLQLDNKKASPVFHSQLPKPKGIPTWTLFYFKWVCPFLPIISLI